MAAENSRWNIGGTYCLGGVRDEFKNLIAVRHVLKIKYKNFKYLEEKLFIKIKEY